MLDEHWAEFGRNYYSRHDYENVEAAGAERMMQRLRDRLADLPGHTVAGRRIESADEFAYDDPVDGSRAEGQGLRILFDRGGRIVFRLSGTGTAGATVRVYLEDYVDDAERLHLQPEDALGEMIEAAEEIAGLREHTGRDEPDVRT